MKKIVPILLSTAIITPTLFTSTIEYTHAETAMKNEVTLERPIPAQEEAIQEKIKESKITKEQAIKIAEDFYQVPSGYKQQAVRFNSNWYPSNITVWTINWSKQEEKFNGHLNITIDANSGKIIEFHHNENNPNEQTSYPPKVTRDHAKELAVNYINKQFPEKSGEVEYDSFYDENSKPPLDGNVNYHMKFNRVVNGYPYQENYLSVNINGNGDITGFSFRWDDSISFSKPTNIITKEAAINIIKDTYPLQLQYQTFYEMERMLPPGNTGTQDIVLTYEAAGHYPFLDADTGKWMNHQGETITTEHILTQLEPLADAKLTEPPQPLNVELTSEEATAKVKEFLSIPENMELEQVNYRQEKYTGNQGIWHLSWRNTQDHLWMNASVNAKTGEIISFHKGVNYTTEGKEESEQKIKYDVGKEKAIQFLKEMIPHKVHQLTLNNQNHPTDQQLENMREYHYNFTRLQDGNPVLNQNISISVSAVTGEINNFYQNWKSDSKFPPATNAVSINKAKEQYLEQFDIQAKYILINNKYYTMEEEMNNDKAPKTALVYELRRKTFDEPVYFDAVKGAWASRRTGEEVIQVKEAKDIQGHWAEEPLKLMIEYKAIDVAENGSVYPNKAITRGEMIKMLMLTTNPEPYYYKMSHEFSDRAATFNDVNAGSKYFAYIETAAEKGLLDTSKKEFNPDELVSREEMAELIVRALGFYELSNVENLFNITFTDAEQVTNKGAVSIVQHLDIMIGNNGAFNPDKKVSRGEAAKVYYEYLKKRGKYSKSTSRF